MATLGSEESGCCREVAILKRFKQESMYRLPTKKGDVHVTVERQLLAEVQL